MGVIWSMVYVVVLVVGILLVSVGLTLYLKQKKQSNQELSEQEMSNPLSTAERLRRLVEKHDKRVASDEESPHGDKES